MLKPNYILFICSILIVACQHNEVNSDKLFSSLPSKQTGITFSNDLEHTESFNAYLYKNFYNGGGVAVGDVNNDGLPDIYFCGNQKDNELYLNQGDFKFKDITKSAKVASRNVWSAGASMVDVNGDGWLDIYVCKSGSPEGENRNNELFINNGASENGEVTFTEKAEEYGINDLGLSSHAAFFDYDKDGDLDCYLLNNSLRSVGNYDLVDGLRERPDSLGGNKLYRNENGKKFVDVSQEAGIYTSAIGFGLGVTIGDVNRDGWQDIFVSNDFFERDYLYINQHDGTFKESLPTHIRELSKSSMGADMADLTNDGFPEIYVTDMMPRDEGRLKTTMTFDSWETYQRMKKNGYHHQFVRNVLQLNTGITDDSDSIPKVDFDEIGRLAGVHATDWSWGALMADFDNNGLKEIFVANGIYKDLMNQDYVSFFNPRAIKQEIDKGNKQVITKMMDAIPSNPLPNYLFVNNSEQSGHGGNLQFENKAEDWGLGEPTFSNGSAYADLDNDGDLDLVVNNVNMSAGIYRNNAEIIYPENRFLSFEFEAKGMNQFGVGTQVSIIHDGQIFYQELAPHRGFQSSVDYKLHFGLNQYKTVDTVIIRWMNDTYTIMTDVETNQTLILQQEKSNTTNYHFATEEGQTKVKKKIFSEVKNLPFTHVENDYSDFNKERLIYHMISTEGPKLAVGDVNGDGKEDFYIGGARGQSGQLFIQNGKNFVLKSVAEFEKDKEGEDVGTTFFDADGDGDLDLYVASGTNELSNASTSLKDRLYFNDGRGNFKVSGQVLPNGKFEHTSCVAANDFDNDGDMDLFVGVRMYSGLYGVPSNSYLLENDGKGNFTNVTKQIAPNLEGIGMVTDATWEDIDGDKDKDLVIVGEWMPLTIFENKNGKLIEKEELKIKNSNGWWNVLKATDIDNDGDVDFVVGNHGLNTRFKAYENYPITMFINDFDQNRMVEQILCAFNTDTTYPFALRHDLVMSLPSLKKRYLKYEDYKQQTINDIFTEKQLENSVILEANEMQTGIFINTNGKFKFQSLPIEAQFAPVYAIEIFDFDNDGNQDILLGGNFYRAKPEVGSYNGSHGLFLRGNGKGNFKTVKSTNSGFFVKGEIRDFKRIGNQIFIAKNNSQLQVVGF
ncbi:MAG: VCBS repeat-containing protein [Saprospiraceae bacterium]